MCSEPLTYATGKHRTPRRTRKRFRALVRCTMISLAVLIPVVIAIVFFRYPWVWYGSHDGYQWHQWLCFTMPDKQVVYDEDGLRAAVLLAAPPAARDEYVGGPLQHNEPLNGGSYTRLSNDSAEYCPPTARALLGKKRFALVFLHKRAHSAGRPLLVLVTGECRWISGDRSAFRISARSCTQDECTSSKRWFGYTGGWQGVDIPLLANQVMRVYAGQPDPNDDAHFTIQYEIDSVPGTIDGRLEADDTVTLKMLNGPAATRRRPAPATRSKSEEPARARQVEVTLLGKTTDLKGMQWPPDPDGRQLSTGVEEPCDLTLHLPSGKTLSIRTRPILIVNRAFYENTVVSVRVPPAKDKPGSLADKAREMEKLMAAWHAVPNEHMRALIEEFKNTPPPSPGGLVPGADIERVGIATLDDRTELDFELVTLRDGKWNMVAVISAGQKDQERILRAGEARRAKALEHPTRQP